MSRTNATIARRPQPAGMVSFATLIALMFLMVFAGMVFNTGQVVTRKIEAQNAADAVAYSSSVWIARGMNAVTASNHMMGELTALYVMHHSLGGRYLDENSHSSKNAKNLSDENTGLTAAYTAAQASPATIRPASKPYNYVLKNPNADEHSTIYQAKRNLKIALAVTYGVHAAAGWGEWVFPPYTIIPGKIAQAIALAAEWKIYQEYLVLTGVEMLAQSTKTFAHKIVGVDKNGNNQGLSVLGALYGYTEAVQVVVPAQVLLVADDIAQRHGGSGMARGDIPGDISLAALKDLVPTLPLEKHKHKGQDRAQLMRATYSWVARWRKPIRTFFKISCTISMAAKEYTHYTNLYSGQAVLWLRLEKNQNYNNFNKYGMGRKGKNFRLYVVEGLNDTLAGDNGFHKSMEKWNKPNNNREIERLFTHMGFARVEPISIAAGAVYRQENPDGFVSFSQSMIYNANNQQAPKQSGQGGDAQPMVGWDTLNWTADAIEYPTDDDLDSPPKIKLNWQARLTPVTPIKLTGTAVATLTDPKMTGPLKRSLEGLILNNH